jgi:hypothetical protein
MEGLSRPDTKKGRLQRACLDLLGEHERDGALPTSIRFLFYELLDRDVIPKVYRDPDGTAKPRTPGQDISDAVGVLREAALIPWDWIVDETRTLHDWRFASTVSVRRGHLTARQNRRVGRRATAPDSVRVALAGGRAAQHRLRLPLPYRRH